MNTHKYILHSFLLIAAGSFAGQLAGQSLTGSNPKRIADGFYHRADYASAAKYYEQSIVGKGKEAAYSPYQVKRDKAGKETGKVDPRHESMYRLAESYRLMNDYVHAGEWYDKLEQEAPGIYPLAAFYLGVSLRANGKYEEAERVFNKFITNYKTKDAYSERAQLELANCIFIQEQLKHPKESVNVARADEKINTEGANYAAGWQNDNTLVFTSTRTTGTTKNGKPIHSNYIYQTLQHDGGWGDTKMLNIPGIADLQQGVVSFTPDGNKLFFTAWFVDGNGKKFSSIYMSEKSDTSWGTPVKVGGGINAENSSSRQPDVTSDGKYLFFASDRAGGKGGFDIWYAELDGSSTPGKIMNAGEIINTKEDDEAPFYHPDSKTLVLASKGRTGLGGFDLYASQGEVGRWSVPQNMGYPVNSVKDDLYFASKGTDLWSNAFISSDRASLCCLELFSVHEVKAPPVEVAKTETKAPVVEEVVAEDPSLVSHSVLFAFNDATVSVSSYDYLDSVVRYLNSHANAKLEIGAHTDGKGSVNYNLRLSRQRANACMEYLVKAGVAAERLVSKGYGECCPLEKETTEEGKDIPEAREMNRRVEVKILE